MDADKTTEDMTEEEDDEAEMQRHHNILGYARIGCRSNPAATGGGAMAESGASHVASTSSHGLGAVQTLRRVVVERWRVHLRPDWGPGNPC